MNRLTPFASVIWTAWPYASHFVTLTRSPSLSAAVGSPAAVLPTTPLAYSVLTSTFPYASRAKTVSGVIAGSGSAPSTVGAATAIVGAATAIVRPRAS